MVYVAVTLGIPDLLAAGPQSVESLASTVRAHPPSLHRVLRALAAQGLMAEDDARRFTLTDEGQALRADVPDSVRPFVACYGEPWWWQSWGALLHGVRTGQTPFDGVHGLGFFDYLDQHDDARTLFQANMSAMTGDETPALVATGAFAGTRVLVDLGGGHGALTAAVLQAEADARAIVFDRPEVMDGATAALDAAGVRDRCELVSGSVFDAAPKGGDTYVLKDILHDWDDAQALRILQVCRRAMPREARLLVIERLLDAAPASATLVDVTMFVLTGGRERTTEEYRQLFAAAGLSLRSVTAASPSTAILEASHLHVE